MPRIEIVMHLQAMDPFRSCAATEIMRLAQIAEPVTFAAGSLIYRPSEPARALFCVVEGRVVVEEPDGITAEVGPYGSFGVFEILSGQQRSSRATAATEVKALRVWSEDFFDLLSNNIDIVKALFRELLDRRRSDQRLPGGELAVARESGDLGG